MKSFILFCLFAIISSFSFGQKATTFFYDADWKITTKEDATYFRRCIIDTTHNSFYGEVIDYYLEGGVQMRGRYFNNIKIDSFYFYHPSGNLESYGFYVDDFRDGIWKYYYKNGILKQVVNFYGADFQVKEYYDSLGNCLLVDGNGIWENEYRVKDMNFWVRVEGPYKNWQRDGKWKIYSHHGNLDEKFDHAHNFKKDQLKSPWYAGSFLSSYFPDKRKFILTENFKYSVYATRKNYPFLKMLPDGIDSLELPYDVHASFPGGDKGFIRFVRSNRKYLRKALPNEKGASVGAEFIIDQWGNITDVQVSPSHRTERTEAQYRLEQEVENLIRSFPKWIPAERNGVPVPQKQFLMVFFNEGEVRINIL